MITTINRNTHYCKSCRELAGMTQEAAASALNISVRRLQAYENGEADIPDGAVDNMVTVYRTPMLAWWHLKNCTALGKYLPDVVMPQSEGDMGMHVVLAEDAVGGISDLIKRLLADGRFTKEEYPDLAAGVLQMEIVSNRMLSAAAFAKHEILPDIKKTAISG